jgi:hypothetical protein
MYFNFKKFLEAYESFDMPTKPGDWNVRFYNNIISLELSDGGEKLAANFFINEENILFTETYKTYSQNDEDVYTVKKHDIDLLGGRSATWRVTDSEDRHRDYHPPLIVRAYHKHLIDIGVVVDPTDEEDDHFDPFTLVS